MSKKNSQYVISRVDTRGVKPGGRPLFKVVKFIAGQDVPEDTYNVTEISVPKAKVKVFMCSCPNSRSGRHIDDKHGRMVADWIKRGEPKTGYYDNEGVYHAQK